MTARMTHFARKISKAKWERKSFMHATDISADAVTACLRTKSNALSFWLCSDDEASLREAALVLASVDTEIEKMYVVKVPVGEIADAGLEVASTPGTTPIGELRDRHRDLVNLTMKSLCSVAELVAPRVRSGGDCHLFTRKDVLALLAEAVSGGRMKLDDLPGKVRSEVAKIA